MAIEKNHIIWQTKFYEKKNPILWEVDNDFQMIFR